MQTPNAPTTTPRLRLAPRQRKDSTGIIQGPGAQPYFHAGRVFHVLQAYGVDTRTTDRIIAELMGAAYDAEI